jgi:uncharacterized protein
MKVAKPLEISGRDAEWKALSDFAEGEKPLGGVGLLYGRRRTGKSFLLRRLVRSLGGFYFQATESECSEALEDFGRAVAAAESALTGRQAEPIIYANWFDALSRRSGLLVIDELPYLLAHSPEIPSLLQRICDEATNGDRAPIRILLCGSSLSVMSSLLRGQEPLRGRATLDLLLRPMDHRDAAVLWGVEDLEVAIRLHAIFGGAPGYRALTNGMPSSVDDFGAWLSTNVLNPNHALYREDDYLLQEERSLTDRSLYGSILRVIASGVASQTEIAGRLGRSRESLSHPIATLVRAGFVVRHEDFFTKNRPEHRLADPIIRFLRLVVDSGRPLLDEGRWSDVWSNATHRIDANIYGPHLEQIARRWVALDYRPPNGFISSVGHAKVADKRSRKSIELDIVAIREGSGVETSSAAKSIALIGEVKWSVDQFGSNAIDRLVHAREVLADLGHDVSHCELALISRGVAKHAGEGLRIGLNDLYV